MNGKKIGSISYANDKILITESPQQLQRIINRLATKSSKCDMKVNQAKTEIMQTARVKIEEVRQYRYLRVLITNDGEDDD